MTRPSASLPVASHWHVALWATLAAILALPLLAMQFTDEVVWTASDFLAAGILLGALGLAFEIAMRMKAGTLIRAGFAALALLIVLTVWAELAVGIF
ncbi:hypothetical protein [Pelagibacterium mangrovi]|uniref:hypothetical protein n=1 Tax=Pelagibacterium mangrovi TaxID=3119828 RepID=UPI002FC9D7F7